MEPIISIIVAVDSKNGIGKDNRIPWYIKSDLIRLKKLTLEHVTILGRSTFESMLGYYEKSGKLTMTQRTHIILTRDKEYKVDPKYGLVAQSLHEALDVARKKEQEAMPAGRQEIFIIGGGQIYTQAIKFADRLYLTIVEGDYEADTFFPDYSEFRKVINEEQHESEGYKYTYLTLER